MRAFDLKIQSAAQWQVETVRESDELFASVDASPTVPLAPMNPFERVNADYTGTSLTTGPHPMALLREKAPHLWRAADLDQARTGERVVIGGMVICRQRPGSAKGFVFVSVERVIHVKAERITPLAFGELPVPASHDLR